MKRWLPLVVVVVGVLSVPWRVQAAPITFTFDTSSLGVTGNLVFASDLIDGDAIGDTSITLDAFDFGGGAPAGVPIRVGGAVGALGGTVTLTDSAFFTSFTQAFTRGATLGFRVDFASTAPGLPQPEGFQVSLLDTTGLPLVTTDPSGFNALIFGELSAGTAVFRQYQLVAVPEPSTLTLLAIGAAGVFARRRLGPAC